MHTLLLRRLSLLFTVIFTASLMIFATGVFAQSATPVGETEITGVLESISSGSIVVSGQTINIVNAEIKNMLIVGSTVKVHVSAVGGALAAREVETTALVDDNSNTNSNANANDNSNANSNANGNSNSNNNANSNANDNTNTNSNDNSNTSAAVSAQQAIDIVLQVYPTTDILSIELTSKFGDTLVWEVKIRNGIELSIDAQTAVILTIDRHGNDNNQNNNGNQNGNVNGNRNGNDNTDDHGGKGSDDNRNGNGNANSNDNRDDHGGNSGSGNSGSDNSGSGKGGNDNNSGMG